MDIAAAILGVAVAAMAGLITWLSWQLGEARAARAQVELNSSAAEKQLTVTSAEFAEFKRRTDAQLLAAEGDAKELRDDLEKCNAPGAQRARLDSLLGKLATRATPATGTRGPGPVPDVAPAAAAGPDPKLGLPGG